MKHFLTNKLEKILFFKKNKNLSNLPWFIIIGAPESGKSTAILNTPPLSPLDQEDILLQLNKNLSKKIINLWNSNKSIFIDTACGILLNNSDKNWPNLLKNIQGIKPQIKIGGVIVFYSIMSLSRQNEYEYTNQAWEIKKRLYELITVLNIKDLQVFFTFSKTDLISGFSDYFKHIDNLKMKEILNLDFQNQSSSSETSLNLFKQDFDILGNSMLKRANDISKNPFNKVDYSSISEFPNEFLSLKNRIYSFLCEIFSTQKSEKNFILKNVYFSSIRSSCLPTSLVGSEKANLPHSLTYHDKINDKDKKAQYINNKINIFKSIFIFLKVKKVKYLLIFLTFLILITIIVYLFFHYSKKSYLSSLNEEIYKHSPDYFIKNIIYNSKNDNLYTIKFLREFKKMRVASNIYDEKNHLKDYRNQNKNKINIEEKFIYIQSLKEYFIPYLKKALEDQLSKKTANPMDLYHTLKVYLMLQEKQHYSPEQIIQWFDSYWQRFYTKDLKNKLIIEELRKNLKVALYENIYNDKLNHNLIQRARYEILQLSPEKFIFEKIKRSTLNSTPDFFMNTLQEGKIKQVFKRKNKEEINAKIPNTFTKKGYINIFYKDPEIFFGKAMAQEREWVLGIDTLSQSINSNQGISPEIYLKVKNLYYEEYIKIWSNYINTLEIVNFKSLEEAINITNILLSEDSPLKFIMNAVHENTILYTPSNKKNHILLGSYSYYTNSENPVDQYFYALNKLLEKNVETNQTTLDEILLLISDLRQILNNLQNNNQQADFLIPHEFAAKILKFSSQLPLPINGWLISLTLLPNNEHTSN